MTAHDQPKLRGLPPGDPSLARTQRPCTPYQRQEICRRLEMLELDTSRVTLFHGRFWLNAGLPEAPLGVEVQAVLSSLSIPQAGALITELSKETSDA